MAEVTTVARPYAEALFRLADQKSTLLEWSALLGALGEVAIHPDMRACVGNPKIARTHVADWFLSLCGGISEEGKNFVRLLTDNNRLLLLPDIRDLFEQLKNERERVLQAEVYTAFPLDEAQKSGLVADLEKKFNRRVNATVALDPELIGGVKVVVGDQVIEASVRARLAAMSIALKS